MIGTIQAAATAIAAVALGSPDKLRFVPTTTQQRFTALQSGEVDVLARATTWTYSRDVTVGLSFAAINLYDGQGFMVKASLGVEGGFGKQLGADNAWVVSIIKAVGNYGEVWDRNQKPLGVDRGLNRLWRDGGLQYAPPFR